jgi:hypothetical protein
VREGLEPFVLPTILNISNDAYHWIGCRPEDTKPTDALGVPHTVQIGSLPGGPVAARIQLFSEPILRGGVPEYLVIVGQLR